MIPGLYLEKKKKRFRVWADFQAQVAIIDDGLRAPTCVHERSGSLQQADKLTKKSREEEKKKSKIR